MRLPFQPLCNAELCGMPILMRLLPNLYKLGPSEWGRAGQRQMQQATVFSCSSFRPLQFRSPKST
eukprot:2190749-Amphidinium_carterae.1